jgi:hypothetical protein
MNGSEAMAEGLNILFDTLYLDSTLKTDMCSSNPERFLFGF